MPEAEHAERITGRREKLRELAEPLAQDPRPLTLEVGCGHGHFLAAYARQHPQRNCVGVDLKQGRVRRARRKQERAALANLHFVRADIADFLAALPAEVRFAEIYVLFPDPWPKRRHHKHRLMREEFLRELAEKARGGSRLFFRTDHADYFATAKEEVTPESGWQVIEAEWPFEYATVFQQKAARHHSFIAALRPGWSALPPRR